MLKATKVDGGIRTAAGTFLPFRKIRGGQEYLEVKYRLVWFREERPEASVSTMYVDLGEQHAVAKAAISITTDKGVVVLATAHKREDKKHFEDFMEKAETGAIGRALAACGYGTQFGNELEEGERIVDAPVDTALHPTGATTSAVSIGVSPVTNESATTTPSAAKRGFRSVSKPVAAPVTSGDSY